MTNIIKIQVYNYLNCKDIKNYKRLFSEWKKVTNINTRIVKTQDTKSRLGKIQQENQKIKKENEEKNANKNKQE